MVGNILLLTLWSVPAIVMGQRIGDIRLLGGSVPHEGRMELYLGLRGWYATCDRTWSIHDAAVVCRQLGYPGVAFATLGSEFGRSTGNRPLARTWNCTGSERKLGQCPYQPTYSCGDAVGVICQDPSYIGCFNDERGIFKSFLQEDYFVSSSLTVESCQEFCSDTMHPIIGLKNGRECYCGDSRDVTTRHSRYSDAMCQEPCSGDDRQICGGRREADHDSISVFDVNLGDCEDPGVPKNGMRLSDWFHFGDIVKFYCERGYEMVGDSVIQCVITKRSDGHTVHWNGSIPMCVETSQTTTVTMATTPITSTTRKGITTQKLMTSSTSPTMSSTTSLRWKRTTRPPITSKLITSKPVDTTPVQVPMVTTLKPKIRSTFASILTDSFPKLTERGYQPSKEPPASPSPRGHLDDVTSSSTLKTQQSTYRSKTTSRLPGDDVSQFFTERDFTYFTEFQTEILSDEEVPKNGLFGLSEDLTILVCVAGILVVCLISIILITITKKLVCRKRKSYHSINIERRLSEEENTDGAYVYEPMTESGIYSRPIRSSLKRGFKRLSRRPWSDADDECDSDEAL